MSAILSLLFFFSLTLHAQPDPNASWQAFHDSYAAKEYKQALTHIQTWISGQEKINQESSAAYYNLALTHWALKDPALTTFSLMKSLQIRTSPVRIWRDLLTVSSIEDRVGFRGGLSDGVFFRSYFLLNNNTLAMIFILSFWLVITFFFLRWWQKKSWPTGGVALVLSAITLVVIGSLGYLNANHFCRFAVIQPAADTSGLYKKPAKKAKEKIFALPSGMIVQLGSEQKGFTKITDPLEGWVATSEVLELESKFPFGQPLL